MCSERLLYIWRPYRTVDGTRLDATQKEVIDGNEKRRLTSRTELEDNMELIGEGGTRFDVYTALVT